MSAGSASSRALLATQLAAGVGSLALVATMLALGDRGYDFSDEGFYLNWISTPHLWSSSTTQFGFVYHPVWVLVGGDVALLRRVTLVITVALSWWAAYLALGRGSRGWPRTVTLSATAAMAALGLRIYNSWLLTPNYNTLALQGTLGIAVGLLVWWSADGVRRATAGAALVGLGVALLFLAKPPGAAATGVLVAIVVLAGGRWAIRPLAAAAAAFGAALLLIAVAIDGSTLTAWDRLRTGADDTRRLDGGHSWRAILHVDDLQPSLLTAAIGLGTFVSISALTWSATSAAGWERRLAGLVGVVALLPTVTLVVLRPGAVAGPAPAAALAPLAVLASAFLVRILRTWAWPSKSPNVTSEHREMVLATGFLVLPLCATLGTNANTWVAASQFALFWALAAAVALRSLAISTSWRAMTATSVAAVILAALPMVWGMQHPYRQAGPVWRFDTVLHLGAHGDLKASAATAHAVANLHALGSDAGLTPGTSVIDLTGQAPGLVFALDGRSINSPWVPGGYPGSGELLVATVDRLPCHEVTSAWLLDQPDGPRSLAEPFFQAIGASADNYAVVGSVTPPTTSSTGPSQPEIRLLHDRRDAADAQRACQTAREER